MESPLHQAIAQMEFARNYSLRLLDATPEDDWYRVPAAGVSHLAWQAGHLAMAEYYLAVERLRGVQPGDEALIARGFLDVFDRGSNPLDIKPGAVPCGEIRATLARVHGEALVVAAALPPQDFSAPPRRPHPLFDTKLGALVWCAQHEMVHAGQIGLLRRQLGAAPRW
jgi:hypothetical protein